MTLTPRFRTSSPELRRFVDRIEPMRRLLEICGSPDDPRRVVNVTGVGGIGKSRFLREVGGRLGEKALTLHLDLEAQGVRSPEGALITLREQSRREVDFDEFDIAYAVWWQRTNPHLRLERRELPFIDESEVLAAVVDAVTEAPLVGTAVNLLRALHRVGRASERWLRTRHNPILRSLDGRPVRELADALVYFFADAVNTATRESGQLTLLTVDAYEALDPQLRTRSWRAMDSFLRDLTAQLEPAVAPIASREPLGWERVDPAWEALLTEVRLDELPEEAREEFLLAQGVDDRDLRAVITRASEGLPFYLQLAVDYLADGRSLDGATTQREILDRFLEHVSVEVISLLEAVSILRVLTDASAITLLTVLEYPEAEERWIKATSYSFLSVENQEYGIHQLMRAALAERLPAARRSKLHSSAAVAWTVLADAEPDSPARRGVALRECCYHRLQAGTLSTEYLLDVADELRDAGQTTAVEGIVDDLHGGLGEDRDPNLLTAACCVEAELAVLRGTPEEARRLDEQALQYQVSDAAGLEASERLRLQSAHALRLLGASQEAMEVYEVLHHAKTDGVRRHAQLWDADLRMATGDFAMALSACASLLEDEVDPERLGDIYRLQHLTYRWAFDLEAAHQLLAPAREAYERGRCAIGLANLSVNEIELLAWSDPERCLRDVDSVLKTQRTLGQLAECGKALTAVAVANLREGRVDAARIAASEASETLARAGYRSGQARASLAWAFVSLQAEREEEALRYAREAAMALVGAGVYPTLVSLAVALLEGAGAPVEEAWSTFATRYVPPPNDSAIPMRLRQAYEELATRS